MSIYKTGQLPFWTEKSNEKKLVYRLPNSIITKKRNHSKVDMIAKEIGLKISPTYLGGFDGNGNKWPSRNSAEAKLL